MAPDGLCLLMGLPDAACQLPFRATVTHCGVQAGLRNRVHPAWTVPFTHPGRQGQHPTVPMDLLGGELGRSLSPGLSGIPATPSSLPQAHKLQGP